MDAFVFDAFERRLQREPDSPVYTIVGDDGQDLRSLSTAEVGRAMEAAAGSLRAQGLHPGDRVVLAYTPSMEFVIAFLGCLRAGLVPAPVPPPDPTGRAGASRVRRFAAFCKAIEAKAVLSNRDYIRRRRLGQVLQALRGGLAPWPELPWLETDGIENGGHAAPPKPQPTADSVAFIELTSGSTREPRGVHITYGNVRHQLAAIGPKLALDADTRCVFWMPHFHDFCLVGGLLGTLSGNGHLYLISPLAFVHRPAIWFEVMSRVGATHTAAPNLAFELALRKTTPEERQAWDLGSLRKMMSAAEPIRRATLAAFYDAFFCTGLRDETICTAYGLAEHTSGVTIGGLRTLRVDRMALECAGIARPVDASDPAAATVLTSCGEPLDGTIVRIVDPETREALPDGRVGEIWVHSRSVAGGYVDTSVADPEAFAGRLRTAGIEDPTPYLRTDDLGFLHDGELFFTGRRSDVIRRGGRMLYPQDVEDSVRDAHPMIRPGRAIACTTDVDGAPGLAVLVEVRASRLSGRTAAEVADAVRRCVLQDHQERCALVWIGQPGSLPKTTSGKPIRRRCRDMLAEGATIPGTLHVATFSGQGEPVRKTQRPASSIRVWLR